jgi:hypothetical protein
MECGEDGSGIVSRSARFLIEAFFDDPTNEFLSKTGRALGRVRREFCDLFRRGETG